MKCKVCNKEKELKEIFSYKKWVLKGEDDVVEKTYHRKICKECYRIGRRKEKQEYYFANKEKIDLYNKEYHRTHSKEVYKRRKDKGYK